MNPHEKLAMAELDRAARAARRMFERKQFPAPTSKTRLYRTPTKTDPRMPGCADCGRPIAYCSGRRCRECFQQLVRKGYAEKVAEEHDRVESNELAFQTVIQREEIMAKAKKQNQPIVRSTSGLRAAIFDEMEALRNGESSWQRARSMAQLASTVLDSVKTEVEYHKYVQTAPKTVENGADNVRRIGTDIALVEQKAA